MNKDKNPSLRFPEFSETWAIKKLNSISKVTSSKRIYESDYVDEGIPFYRGKEITELKNGKAPSDILYIKESKYERFKDKFGVPNVDDILITSVGTLGNVYRIRNSAPFYFKDGNLIWLKEITENPSFLEFLLEKNRHELLKVSIGSTQKALTIVEIRKL